MFKKIILLISILFILLIIQLLLLFWNKNNNKIYIIKNCNFQESCKLPYGGLVYIKEPIKLNYPFDIQVKINNISNIDFYFSMEHMDMGFNKYNLNYDKKNNIWVAKNIILPICTFHRNDYILNLIINNKIEYKIPFKITQ